MDSDAFAVMQQELGRQLAALRRGAGLTQQSLGTLMGFSRSTVSVAEIGRQPHARAFWAACDKALDTSGVLTAGFDQIKSVREARERAAACAAQEAREARALATLTSAQHRDGLASGVTAVQPCPHCGCRVAVLTTLVSQPPGPATVLALPAAPALASRAPAVTSTCDHYQADSERNVRDACR
jgi:transcriptional regulator with XRE-family HTH domain